MFTFLKRIFGVKGSSAENVGMTVKVEQPVVMEEPKTKEEFFNTPQNSLLDAISQALSDSRHETLKVLIEEHKKKYGRLAHDDFFYRYDIATHEWYMCSPLYKWCSNIETRDLFYRLVRE